MAELFGGSLRRHRRALGLTQEELAERALLSGQAVGALERGDRRFPRQDTVARLADALKLTGEPRAAFVAAAPRRRIPQALLPGRSVVNTRDRGEFGSQSYGPLPRELPADTRGFVGREAQLEELDQLLDRNLQQPTAAPVVVVCGTAGVGKTALAVHWAHHVIDRFPDGQLHVNLRGYDQDMPISSADALAAFLRSLGVPGGEIPHESTERVKRYRTLLADRRMLILLDNAHSVDQVLDLLPGSPTSFVLVTSREALAGLGVRHGAHRITLEPLPATEAHELLRIHVGDRLDTAPHAAAVLIDQCARLPLALRIAAQLAVIRPTAPLGELVSELEDEQHRLEVLDVGDPQNSVHNVFYWSYRHLPEPSARLFRLLSVHPGRDIDRYAAAALMGIEARQARHLLVALSRAHLIQETANGRYGMHDLLRAYATHQAHHHDTDHTRQAALTRLFDYYLHAAARAMDVFVPYERHRRPTLPDQPSTLPTFTEREPAVAWLDAERANLVAVAVHAAGHGWPSHASRLSTILYRYLTIGAHWADATHIHTAAMRTPNPEDQIPGLATYGMTLFRLGRLHDALEHNHRALTLIRQIGDRINEGRVLMHLGAAYSRLGRQQDALDHYQQALSIVRMIEDRQLEAICLENIGLVFQRMNNLKHAFDTQYQALMIYREVHDPHGEVGVLGNLGVTCSKLGRHQEAHDHQQHALVILHAIGDRQHEAETLNDIGTTLHILGNSEKALERHQQALASATHTGDRYDQSRAHEGIAQALHTLGDMKSANIHWNTALTLHNQLGTPHAHHIATVLGIPQQP